MVDATAAGLARTLWRQIETLNAVTYFSPECRQAPLDLGMRGFWMGYVACRAAPLGQVGPGVVEATFYNFHPGRVARALPDAWTYATPSAVLDARWIAAATALRRILGVDVDALALAATDAMTDAIAVADPGARPLFAANRSLTPPDDHVAAFWHAATTLREHRGDGHVALLAAEGIDGCEALVLATAVNGVDGDLYRIGRGWSEDEWDAARSRLEARGLVDHLGAISVAGSRLHEHVERRTDALALLPFAALDATAVEGLIDALAPAARTVAAAGDISYPNPMGLPNVADD